MRIYRALVRLSAIILTLFIGMIVILATSWMPLKIRGIRISAWPATIMARLALTILNVKVEYQHTEKLLTHSGFIFPNHLSFLDIIMMLHIIPVRFLSKAELRSWPLVGWIARGIGTVFVDRSDRDSREAARQALAEEDTFPPIVLFPEGGIFSPAEELKPFRYGAFEIAHAGTSPFYPCALQYEPLDIVFWADESIWTAVWRFAKYKGPIYARINVLRMVSPQPDDDPKELALETHGAIDSALRYGGHESDLIQPGL